MGRQQQKEETNQIWEINKMQITNNSNENTQIEHRR